MTDQAKPKIWTPDQKVPENVRKMAFLFFMECFKANQADLENDFHLGEEATYRDCIETAKMIYRVDAENDAPKT